MNLVAVIVAYWPDRFVNIPAQVEDLLVWSTVKPDKVIVFNNNPHHQIPWELNDPRLSMIDSATNFTSRSKYAIAMLEPSAYYILLDDDVSVGPRSIEGFQRYAFDGCALCDWGVSMGQSNFLSKGVQVKGPEITEPVKVDAFIGRAQYLSFEAIIRLFQAEKKCRLPNLPDFRSVGEDILVALCNPDAMVVPVHGGEWLKSPVTTGQQAMQDDQGYMQFRDVFAHQARLALGLTTLEELPAPGNESELRLSRAYLDILEARERS